VSHGAQWYFTKAFSGKTEPAAPPEYCAYVGHFESNYPESPLARVFVRDGRLWAMMSLHEQAKPTLLEPIAEGLFRLGDQVYSPERVRFDTIVDGAALRMTLSGVPLYRKDTP
jgi:hypothetical protein